MHVFMCISKCLHGGVHGCVGCAYVHVCKCLHGGVCMVVWGVHMCMCVSVCLGVYAWLCGV